MSAAVRSSRSTSPERSTLSTRCAHALRNPRRIRMLTARAARPSASTVPARPGSIASSARQCCVSVKAGGPGDASTPTPSPTPPVGAGLVGGGSANESALGARLLVEAAFSGRRGCCCLRAYANRKETASSHHTGSRMCSAASSRARNATTRRVQASGVSAMIVGKHSLDAQ
eukprot:5995330-Prymnesium_polylepis.1